MSIIFELEGKRALVCAASSVTASLWRETCEGICSSLFEETHRAREKAAPLLTALGRTPCDYCISIILEIAPSRARVNRTSCMTARVLVTTGRWAEGTCHVLSLYVASWTCVCITRWSSAGRIVGVPVTTDPRLLQGAGGTCVGCASGLAAGIRR